MYKKGGGGEGVETFWLQTHTHTHTHAHTHPTTTSELTFPVCSPTKKQQWKNSYKLVLNFKFGSMILIWFSESGPLVCLLHCRHVGLVWFFCFGLVWFLFSSKCCVAVSKLLLEAVMLQWCSTLTRFMYHFSYWCIVPVYYLKVVWVCHYSTSLWREGVSLCVFINKNTHIPTYILVQYMYIYFTYLYNICTLYNKHIHVNVIILYVCVFFICLHIHM